MGFLIYAEKMSSSFEDDDDVELPRRRRYRERLVAISQTRSLIGVLFVTLLTILAAAIVITIPVDTVVIDPTLRIHRRVSDGATNLDCLATRYNAVRMFRMPSDDLIRLADALLPASRDEPETEMCLITSRPWPSSCADCLIPLGGTT